MCPEIQNRHICTLNRSSKNNLHISRKTYTVETNYLEMGKYCESTVVVLNHFHTSQTEAGVRVKQETTACLSQNESESLSYH